VSLPGEVSCIPRGWAPWAQLLRTSCQKSDDPLLGVKSRPPSRGSEAPGRLSVDGSASLSVHGGLDVDS
jgi:hypothetical protein